MSVPLLKAAALAEIPGVVHGFTTRDGGVSAGPFASLNLGLTVGDDRESVNANRSAVLDALGKRNAIFVALRQVHGDQVVQVTRYAGRTIEADALWTRDRSAVLAVLVADCVPILLADVKGRAVAAAHAGWRGTKAKIAAKLVQRLADQGIPTADLRVALGPAIGPEHFEIGPEVAAELREAFPDAGEAVRPGEGDRAHADLWALNQMALIAAGVPREHIEVLRESTVASPRLYSHRRDGGTTGRQAGVIGLRG